MSQVSEPIAAVPEAPWRMQVGGEGVANSKPCSTEIYVVDHGLFMGHRVSSVRLRPKTGRRHQLRVHLTHLKHPIVGDVTYANDVHSPRMMLHALELTLPLSNKKGRAPPPPDVPPRVFRTLDPFAKLYRSMSDLDGGCDGEPRRKWIKADDELKLDEAAMEEGRRNGWSEAMGRARGQAWRSRTITCEICASGGSHVSIRGIDYFVPEDLAAAGITTVAPAQQQAPTAAPA